jgi:acyl-CoA thioesterase I
MKQTKKLTGIIVFLIIAISCYSQGYHKRIAFIGNSITIGATLTDAPHERFPTLVDTMLRHIYGDTCIVGNFAVSGRTMLKHGDFPIWNEPDFKNCWQFAPDIFIIMLGTNDTKPYNWDDHHNDFFTDYMSMIDTFKTRNPQVKFIISRPPPAFCVNFDIRNSVLIDEVIPLVDSVAKVTGAAVVDYYHPFLDSTLLFPDCIHPNAKGHRAMAKILYDKLIETDYINQVDTARTYVSHFASSNLSVRDKDTATLSWTTINADTAYLNGIIVPVNGSKKVNAKQNTIYTLKAKGKLNSDSLNLSQDFYHPVLTKILLSPVTKKIDLGDTVKLSLRFQDQKSRLIIDTLYTIDWSISVGDGTLIDKTSTNAKFVASQDQAGTAQVIATVDAVISNPAVITINPLVNIASDEISNDKVFIYPNPVNNLLNVSFNTHQSASVRIRIYNVMGMVQIDQNQSISDQGRHNVVVKTESLTDGIYFLVLDYSDKHFVQKINVLVK